MPLIVWQTGRLTGINRGTFQMEQAVVKQNRPQRHLPLKTIYKEVSCS